MSDNAAQRSAAIASFNPYTMMEFYRPAVMAMTDLNEKFCSNVLSMNSEWANFVNRRLKQDVAFSEQLLGCKSIGEMYSLYADFMHGAFDAYHKEFSQMAQIGSEATNEVMHVLQHSMETGARTGKASAKSRH